MSNVSLLQQRCLITQIAWQRGSNENINGLVRQCLYKGTDLSVYSRAQLEVIANQINNRPHKGLRVFSSMAAYTELMGNSQKYSALIH